MHIVTIDSVVTELSKILWLFTKEKFQNISGTHAATYRHNLAADLSWFKLKPFLSFLFPLRLIYSCNFQTRFCIKLACLSEYNYFSFYIERSSVILNQTHMKTSHKGWFRLFGLNHRFLQLMEQRTLKNVNNYLNTNIYSYLGTCGGKSSILNLNVVNYFNHQC